MEKKLRKLFIKGTLKGKLNSVLAQSKPKDNSKVAKHITYYIEYERFYLEAMSKVFGYNGYGNIELETMVKGLQEARAKGKNVYAYAGAKGIILYSANVTIESAYKAVFGCTKSEYEKAQKAKRGKDTDLNMGK